MRRTTHAPPAWRHALAGTVAVWAMVQYLQSLPATPAASHTAPAANVRSAAVSELDVHRLRQSTSE